MTPEAMAENAAKAIEAGTFMTLVRPRGAKMPQRFPRGELLCENQRGGRLYSYDPLRVLAWLVAHELVDVTIATPNTEVSGGGTPSAGLLGYAGDNNGE